MRDSRKSENRKSENQRSENREIERSGCRKSVRTWCLLLAAVGMTFAGSFAAMAEEERTPVGRVTLDVESSIQMKDVGSDVEVTTDSDECFVTNVDVLNEPDGEWKYKAKPKVEITLEPEDGYYFKSGFSKGKISLTGSGGSVASVRRKSAEELIVTVTLKALKAGSDAFELDTDEAEWDEYSGTGSWSDSEDAAHYELRIYRDEKLVTSIGPVRETYYNFAKYITGAGTYRFEVRGVYNASRKGEWQESDTFEVSAEKAAEISAAAAFPVSGNGPASGTWKNDAAGWWYENPDGTYVTNNWQQIGGRWYFFDEQGYRKSGWIIWNEKWYYLDDNGAMLADSVTPDGKYVGGDGALIQ